MDTGPLVVDVLETMGSFFGEAWKQGWAAMAELTLAILADMLQRLILAPWQTKAYTSRSSFSIELISESPELIFG